MLIVGSYLGAATDPAWVHNLPANPHARIEVVTETYDVVAHELLREERDELYAGSPGSHPCWPITRPRPVA
jgi:deazaflavin-dependent oxidoreductase (nitroreductase family)